MARTALTTEQKETKLELSKSIDNSMLLTIIRDRLASANGSTETTPRGKLQEKIKELEKENKDLKKQLDKIKSLLG